MKKTTEKRTPKTIGKRALVKLRAIKRSKAIHVVKTYKGGKYYFLHEVWKNFEILDFHFERLKDFGFLEEVKNNIYVVSELGLKFLE